MNNSVLSKVFIWLFVGLLVTFGIGYGMHLYFYKHLDVAVSFFSRGSYWIIFIIEFILVIWLSARIYKMSSLTAKLLYLLYCGITGLTFSSIFILFKLDSIIFVFLATAVIFGIFGIIGSRLNVDLSKFGLYLFIALLGSIIMSIINIFLGLTTLDLVLSIIVIIIFTLYIGYDIQKVKALEGSGIPEENLAIFGAFQLFLDFINIFIRLLSMFGKSKD